MSLSDFRGKKVVLYFYSRDNTPGSIAILDETNRVLISGDSVQDGNIFMFGSRRDLNRFIVSMEHLAQYDGLFDEVWAMHGTFPVKPDLIPKLIGAAEAIRDGKAAGNPVEVHGNAVCLYIISVRRIPV